MYIYFVLSGVVFGWDYLDFQPLGYFLGDSTEISNAVIAYFASLNIRHLFALGVCIDVARNRIILIPEIINSTKKPFETILKFVLVILFCFVPYIGMSILPISNKYAAIFQITFINYFFLISTKMIMCVMTKVRHHTAFHI